MLEEKREKFKTISEKTGLIFSKFGLTPNQYTLFSLLLILIAFYFLINQRLTLALIFFLISAVLDFIDGAVARFLKQETKKGAYLDTICDRYIEGTIFLGFLFLPLPDLILPAKVWIFLALFGSLMTTYSKAAAKEKELVEKELKRGLLGRGERIILISLALILGIFDLSLIICPIIIIAVLANITSLQRIFLSLAPAQN